jgi:hypothetical protein
MLTSTNYRRDCLSEEKDYFTLPRNSQNFESLSLYNARSCKYIIKFQISPAHLSEFVATTFIREPLSSTSLPQLIGGITQLEAETNWQVKTISSFLTGEAQGTGDHYLDEQFIFVDVTDKDFYTVYLVTKKNWI